MWSLDTLVSHGIVSSAVVTRESVCVMNEFLRYPRFSYLVSA